MIRNKECLPENLFVRLSIRLFGLYIKGSGFEISLMETENVLNFGLLENLPIFKTKKLILTFIKPKHESLLLHHKDSAKYESNNFRLEFNIKVKDFI